MLRITGLLILFFATFAGGASASGDDLVLCGMEEVFTLDPDVLAGGKLEKKWSWRAADQKSLPVSLVSAFRTTDDCKPIHDGRQILITSSGGGCALVDYPSGDVRWFAHVPNAHSIELLPGNRVVVAGSTNPKGNLLALFDLSRSEEPFWSTPLHSAHGVVWDAERESLWALGFDELRRYRLEAWETKSPSLKLEQTFSLPDDGGHDLQPVPGTSDLVVTTHNTVLLFDREKQAFRPHPELQGRRHVKAVATHPVTGKTYFVQASDENWWSETLRSLTPPAAIPVAGERLYKIRWRTSMQQP